MKKILLPILISVIILNGCIDQSKNKEDKIWGVDELISSNLPEGTLVKVRVVNNGCQAINFKVTDDYEGPGSGIYLNNIKIAIDSNKEVEEICSPKYVNKEITIIGTVKYCGGKKVAEYICGLTDVELIDETTKIYSVDELAGINIEEETEVLVKGKYSVRLLDVGPDYEGPGSGAYLYGEKAALYLSASELKNVEANQMITVKGKVSYCGGKKVAKYICGLTDVSLVYNEDTSWSGTNCIDSDNGKDIYKSGFAKTVDNKGVTLHITSDSCAIKQENNYPTGEARYLQGLASCSGDNCFIEEGYCHEYMDSVIDGKEFIQCPNGCNDGVCIK